MAENKRFISQRTDDYNFSDILDNGKWIGICHVDCEDDFVDKLNELHEKKEILEVQLRSATNEIDKLESEIDMLTDTCHDCCKEIREENKELKQLIKKVIDERVVDYPLLCELKKMVKE